MKAEIKKLPKSEIEIEFEMDEKEFDVHIDRALDHLKGHVKMDGFRPGSVPKEMVEKKVGAENLLMEAGDLAVKAAYTKYVRDNNLEPVGEPGVQIKKIAKGNPFLFTVKVAVLPEIELPDYKEIAKSVKVGQVLVEPKEIDEALAYLQKSRAKFTDKATGAENKDYVKISYQNENINGGKEVKDMFILGEVGFLPDFENNVMGMKTGEEKEFMIGKPDKSQRHFDGPVTIPPKADLVGEGLFKVKMLAVQIMELPEINDEFAKGLGVFDSLVALKDNLKEGIGMEKKETERARTRGQIIGKIAEKIKFELPEKMVEYEQARLLEELKMQVTNQFKIDFTEYLKNVKKTEEEIKATLKEDAEKRIKNFLVLRQVGKVENVEVGNEELEEETNKELRKYDKEKIDINRIKEYTKSALNNEKVFQLLENFSK